MIIGFDGSRLDVAQRTGTEQYSYLLLQHLLELPSQARFRVYTRRWLDDPMLQHERVEQRVIGWPRLWTQAGLALELWRDRVDVLFIPAHTLPVLRPLGIKSVVTIHDLGYEWLPQHHQFPGRLYLNRSTEYAAAHASHLIAVSEFTKQDLQHKLGVNPDKVEVIHLGVDVADLKPAAKAEIEQVRQKYALAKPYILFVGTVQPRKNLVRLIEAFSRLDVDRYDLVIAGGPGWLSDEIYATPAALGIAESVRFIGYIDEQDKAGLYSGAEMTALVSLFEGFGLPVIESMACGTPVIASDGSSLTEVVGKAGVLVEPTSVSSIHEGMITLLEKKDVRQQLIKLGFDQIKKFDWQQTAEKTLMLLEKVASR